MFISSAQAQCVGESGQVSWHYWGEIPYYGIEHLYVDDSYPMGPDKIRTLSSISSPPNYNDQYGSIVKGFISVPQSSSVSFNVTGDDECYFLLSTDATKNNLDTLARTLGWTGQNEHIKFPEQTSSPVSLSAGNLYYFELHLREGGGGDHSTVYWQRPYVDQNSWLVISSPFLTDVCDPICPPKYTPCNDGDSSTTNDIEDGNCNCSGAINSNTIPLGVRSELDAYFYDDIASGDINTLLQDPKFPAMPDRMEVNTNGLNVQWQETYNNFGVLIQGYLYAPVSGAYDFNVTGTNQVRFYLSSDATDTNKTANMIETQWGSGILDHDVDGWDGSQTASNVTLVEGQLYYFELIQKVSHWGFRFDIFWNAPWHQDDGWHKVPEIHFYDYTDELACLPEGAACNDGDPYTKNDTINDSCECIGIPCTNDCDDPEAQFFAYDYCETTYELGNRSDDAWLSCDPGSNPHLPIRDGYHWIHYDLGDEYLLTETHVWNYNVDQETNKGFENVAVDYSLDGQNWFELGEYSWAPASGQSMYSGFSGPNFNGEAVRYVMFTSLDDPNTCRGVSKINFTVEQCMQQGISCDDDIASTYNDHYNDKCECIGYTLEEMNCGADTLFLNEVDMDPSTYHAVKSLISEGEVINANNINYKAGVEIILNSGFEVESGSIFEANIEDCPPPALALKEPEQISQNLKKKVTPESSLQVFALDSRTEQTIRFYLPEPTLVNLDILNQKGEIVSHFTSHNYESKGSYYKRLQTKKIKAGVYLIRMTTEDNVITEKMVVL